MKRVLQDPHSLRVLVPEFNAFDRRTVGEDVRQQRLILIELLGTLHDLGMVFLNRLDAAVLGVDESLIDGLGWKPLQRSMNARGCPHFFDHAGHRPQTGDSQTDTNQGTHAA